MAGTAPREDAAPPVRPSNPSGARPPRAAPPKKKKKKKAPAAAQQPPAPVHSTPAASSVPNSGGGAAMADDLQVFDGMLESNNSFMDLMNGDVMGIEEMDLTNDVLLEVTPLVKKKRARTGNYSTAEDEALVLAWENVALDPIIGTNQDGSTYWNRIADYYHRIMKSKSVRTTKSLQQRWCSIQECCNQWAGCMVSVEDNQPSGTTLIDLVPIAQELYKQKDLKHHRPFVMLHYWQLLKDNEKWRARPTDSTHKKLKSCNSSSPYMEEEEDDEDDSADEGEERRRSPTPSSRPPGRKQEKERVKKQGQGAMYKEVLEKMMHNKQELGAEKKKDKEEKWQELKAIEERKVAIEEERLQIKKGAEQRLQKEQDQKIMFMDTSSLDPQQLAFVEAMRAQILASMTCSGFSFGDASSL